MKHLLIAFLAVAIFSGHLTALNYAKMCCVRDNECLKTSIDTMFVILRKMNRTVSPDVVIVEKTFVEPFDLDIASGTATMHKCEISNILSAQVKNLRSKANGEYLYVLLDLVIPSINAVGYGEAHVRPKLLNIGPLRGVSLPTVINTKGKMKTTFKNIPMSLAFQFKMIDQPGGKIGLSPEHIDGKLDCGTRTDDKYTFIPDPGFRNRIAKIFMELTLSAKSQEICEMMMAKDEHKKFVEENFKNRTMKHFGRVRFLDC